MCGARSLVEAGVVASAWGMNKMPRSHSAAPSLALHVILLLWRLTSPAGTPKHLRTQGKEDGIGRRGILGGWRWWSGEAAERGEDNAKASRTCLDARGRRAGLPGRGRWSNWFHHGRN
ncbi:hypothetical protein E2C01_004134 [Portunus trituberculatus]|uniref:Uncharacterized protein n=1 Tax=Portunus trituberculatus TaxID=210409 RepID=A0A5B7CP21_PORTR|nr:hypothetical protein [Portunus trituberculatus]